MAALAGLLLTMSTLATSGDDWQTKPMRFPLVVSDGVIAADVNEGDATVAMRAWRDVIAKQFGFFVDVHVSNLANLTREIREHQVDGFLLTTLEYLEVAKYASPSLLIDEPNSKGGDEYVLLVHEESGIRTTADLHRKSLNVFDNPRMCLAATWLETLLAPLKSGMPKEYFSRVSAQNKLSRAVLPVYFRQADACLVTRRGFATMCELNPQLARKLRVIASSPALVTTLIGFHKDCAPERRQRYQKAFMELQKTPTGQQALTLFEYNRLLLADSAILRNVTQLVIEHDRLYPLAVSARK